MEDLLVWVDKVEVDVGGDRWGLCRHKREGAGDQQLRGDGTERENQGGTRRRTKVGNLPSSSILRRAVTRAHSCILDSVHMHRETHQGREGKVEGSAAEVARMGRKMALGRFRGEGGETNLPPP